MAKFNIIYLIVLYLISFTKSEDIIDIKLIKYDFTKDYTESKIISANKTQTYEVDFKEDKSNIPFYIKVQVTSDDNNPAPRLCFSTSDPKCEKEREQLVKDPNDIMAFFWVKREQFISSSYQFYLLVECENTDCSYTIRIEGAQNAIFQPNFVYSYLVTSDNKDMTFVVEGTETNVFMTVAIEGSYKATLNVDESTEIVEKYKTGSATTFFIEESEINTSNLATITIKKAEVDEYITLSVHIINSTENYKGDAQNGLILPNGPEITVLLEDELIKKECFPIDLSNKIYNNMDKLYITGRIHTKYISFYLEDEKRNIVKNTNLEISNGQLGYVLKNNRNLNYICFELSDKESLNQNKIIFSFSVSEPNSLSNLYSYYPPQLTGEIYRRIIPKDKIVFFSGTKNDITAQKYDYSLYQIRGTTKMYISDCRSYPNCQYTKDDLQNLIEPKNINQMSIWTTVDGKSSAIGDEKFIIVAQCLDDDNENNGYCEFETSIFEKEQDITLVENEKFSKFVLSNEKGSFIADLKFGLELQILTFDIMIFSGDVTFNVKEINTEDDVQISYIKYYLSNKIFIHFNIEKTLIDNIIIDYQAVTNSFFTIQYSYSNSTLDQSKETIPSGESYLVQINPATIKQSKDLYLSNYYYKNKNQYLVNFFKLNCEFEVKRGNTEIHFFDGYAQEILNYTSPDYNNSKYKYTVKITEPDNSNYKNKMCMLYVTGYEAETEYEREIIIGDNINQQIIFNNYFRKIRFLYPLSDQKKDIALYINVIDKAFYKYTIFSHTTNIEQSTITRSKIIYLRYSKLTSHCTSNLLCPIIIQIEYETEIIKTDPMIEITVREIKNSPSYLQKGQAKLDYVCGDRYYYLYTDIGKQDIAEITINFLREFGSLWAKVVKKYQKTIEDGANWRGIYRMPSEEYKDSLPFNKYIKKLTVNSEDTYDCIEGCYLLISIQISQIGEYVEDYDFYPFSIITRITPNDRSITDIPKVVIQVDEFIIGSVDLAQNDKIVEFYEIWFPHDSEIVLFDWQSSVAGLYINLGGIRPSSKNADFKLLPPGKDTILNLTRNEIIEKAKSKKDVYIPHENSLQDINLVIGVWTDKTDSINTEIYSLRIHQADLDNENNLDITQVNTDQKILCNPTLIKENEYRCLFVVIYDDKDVNMRTPLLVYGGSLNHGALNYIYANFIERNIYDEFIREDLNNSIPNDQTAILNSRKEGVDYIYIKILEKGKYMFININTDKPEPIMIVTSMPVYNYIEYDLKEYYPNPTTEQLLSVSGERLRLSFPCTNSVMVDIITLNGHAEISWKSDPNTVFVMRGVGDRISLSSGNELDELIINRLDETNNNNKNDKLTMDDPGFVFYITYIIKDNSIKFNEIHYGKSLEITYKDVDLPVFLYSKIGSEYRDINIAITFKDNEVDKSGIYELSPLIISAQLVKENLIYEIKKDPELKPIDKDIQGYYDSALKTAQIFLSEDIIKNYNIKDSDNPTIYIIIDKNKDAKLTDKIYEKFSVEAQVSGVNDGVIPVEKIYHYGRVRNINSKETFYRLKTDKNRPFMRFQIAFNSDNLDFVVSDTENLIKNITFLKSGKDLGKIYVTFGINKNVEIYYLYIYKKKNTRTEEHLNNYAFKYFNVKNLSEILDYKILSSPEISIDEKKKDGNDIITCTFNKLDIEDGKANITYFFKVAEKSTYYNGEEYKTIAVTESPYYTVYERNPLDIKGEITLTAEGKLSNWEYLNVIAQVQQNNVIEYISYNGKKRKEDYSEENNDFTQTLFIIIGSILIVIILGLIITICIFHQRHKYLLSNVRLVSFQKQNNNTDPNLLLKDK